MSEQNTAGPVTPNTPNTPTKKVSAKRVPHSVAIAKFAAAKKMNTNDAGKMFRSRLRSNFDTVSKLDGTHYGKKGKVKRIANDRTPWGDHSVKVLRELFPNVKW